MDDLDVAMCGRGRRAVAPPRGPKASSASRAARSPIAWKWGWNPCASSRVTAAQHRRIDEEMPRFPSARRRAPRYGSSIAPVKFSRTPSSMSFTLVGAYGRRPSGPLRDELLDLLEAAVALPPQRPDDPGADLAAAGHRQVGLLVAGSTIASCQLVIPSEWR